MAVYQTPAGGRPSGLRRLSLFIALVAAVSMAASAAMMSPRPAAALDSEEVTVLQLLNDYRAANGLGTLSLNDTLNQSARWMSEDMATNNYFSHTDSQGRDPFQRIGDFGYTYNTWKGENLAAGVSGAQAAFDLWKGSPGHNANMLNPNYSVVGIARAFHEGSTFSWYWTTDFGGQADPPPPPEPTEAPPPPPPIDTPPSVTPAPQTPAPAPVTPAVTVAPATPDPSVAQAATDLEVSNGRAEQPWWFPAIRVSPGLVALGRAGQLPPLVALANSAAEYLVVTSRNSDAASDFWHSHFADLVLKTGR